METVNRKVTYRLYPSASEASRLYDLKGLHQRLYNAALEERILAYQDRHVSVTYAHQCKQLTWIRQDDESYRQVNAQSLQVTLKRLDLAFQNFFRRLKTSQKAGFPRFKSYERFSSFGYKSHRDGWRFEAGKDGCDGSLRLSSVGWMKLRGKPRKNPITGERELGHPKTLIIYEDSGRWYASITFEVPLPVRLSGTKAMAFDWGITHYLTILNEDLQVQEISNPRYLQASLQKLKQTQKALSRKTRGSHNYHQCRQRLRRHHQKVTQQRQNFTHELSAKLVRESSFLVSESLNVKAMLESQQNPHSSSLHRSIADGAPGGFLQKLRYKAEEAGIEFEELPTQRLRPSQRCFECDHVQRKKLWQREHHCQKCGVRVGRDVNAAAVMLKHAFKNKGQELALSVETLNRKSKKHETPPKAQRA